MKILHPRVGRVYHMRAKRLGDTGKTGHEILATVHQVVHEDAGEWAEVVLLCSENAYHDAVWKGSEIVRHLSTRTLYLMAWRAAVIGEAG